MALIKCPECESPVSDKAKSCPNCGFPINKEENKPVQNDNPVPTPIKEEEPKKKNPIIKIIVIIAIITAIIVAFISCDTEEKCGASGCNNTKTTDGYYCSSHTCFNYDCDSYKSKTDTYCSYHEMLYSSYSSSYSESATDVLDFSNVKLTDSSSYTCCSGTLTNNGSKTYYFVQVKGAFKDVYGNVIDTDWTYAVGSEGLAPGESTKFEIYVDKSYLIDDVSLTIYDYST